MRNANLPSVLLSVLTVCDFRSLGAVTVAGLVLAGCVSGGSEYSTATNNNVAKTVSQPAYQAAAIPTSAIQNQTVQRPAGELNGTASAIQQPSPVASTVEQPLVANADQAPSTFIAQKIHTASIASPGIQTSGQTSGQINGQVENAFVDPLDPETLAQQRIDQLYPTINHATCKGGWATPPDKLDAKRTSAGHPYYMEMRLRHTPLLPVGHTYIAYGHLSEDGRPVDEHVVMLSPIGGYGGAAVAAAIPMPGIMTPVTDDCRLKPIAAYRVSLTAQDYEKLLVKIKQAHKIKPSYALFAYNCNHFASDIAGAVGIRPPKNKYAPALQYIYGVIEANEGYDPRKRRRG